MCIRDRTYPAAGVIATRPESAPDNNPKRLVVFLSTYSSINQPNVPALAAMTVLTKDAKAI